MSLTTKTTLVAKVHKSVSETLPLPFRKITIKHQTKSKSNEINVMDSYVQITSSKTKHHPSTFTLTQMHKLTYTHHTTPQNIIPSKQCN